MGETKVEQQPGVFDIYMRGAKLRVVCAVCGEVYERDFGDRGIYYPTANKEFEHTFYHGDEEHETKVRLKITVGLEVCHG